MKIERNHFEGAYRYGIEVYEGRLSLSEAQTFLDRIGMNRASAAQLIYNLGQMIRGRSYKRTMSVFATDYFLDQLQKDKGEQILRNALSAYSLHLEYYRNHTGSPMNDHVNLLNKYRAMVSEKLMVFISPEETIEPQNLVEGRPKTISVNVFERNQRARLACIEEYGPTCSVCGFNFETIYGILGKDFIHVHHLRDLALIGKEYIIDPKNDLRPVCPNCHAMLHKSSPAYTIEELKCLIRR